MKIKFTIKTKDSEILKTGRHDFLLSPFTLGRQKDNHIILDQPHISRHHAKIEHVKDKLKIIKLSHKGKLLHNGKPVQEEEFTLPASFEIPPYSFELEPFEEKKIIVPKNVLEPSSLEEKPSIPSLGPETFPLALEEESILPQKEETKITSRPMKAKIIVLKGMSPAQSYDLIGDEILLGRDEDCDIVLEDTQISREHSKITLKDNHYWVQDLESTNGTLVNHVRIEKELELSSGDHIQLGGALLQFAVFDEDSVALQLFSQKKQLSRDSTQSGIFSLPSWEPEIPSYILKKLPRSQIFLKLKQRKIALAILTLFLLILTYFLNQRPDPSRKMAEEIQKLPAKPMAKPDMPPDMKEGLSQLTEQDREYALAKFSQAKDLSKNRRYEEAKTTLQEALRIAPHFKAALDLQTIIRQTLETQLQEEKKWEAVALEKKLEEEVKYHLGVALDYFNRQQWEKAVEEYDKILELTPEHEEAQQKRSLAQEKLEVKTQKEEKISSQKKKNKDAERLLAEGSQFSQKQKIQEALTTWRKVLKMEGIDPQYYAKAEQFINFTKAQLEQKYDPLVGEAIQLIESKEHLKAKEILDAILKEYPSHSQAQALLDKIFFALHGIAKRQYTEAIIDENMGRIEAAKEKFKWIIERTPATDEYHRKAQNKLKKYE